MRLATHKLVLREEEEQARAAIERAFEQAGLAVPALAEVLAKSGVELKRARSILQILLREKNLVRISDELMFHHSAIAQLKAMLSNRRSERFGVAAFKDWTGISRKQRNTAAPESTWIGNADYEAGRGRTGRKL